MTSEAGDGAVSAASADQTGQAAEDPVVQTSQERDISDRKLRRILRDLDRQERVLGGAQADGGATSPEGTDHDDAAESGPHTADRPRVLLRAGFVDPGLRLRPPR